MKFEINFDPLPEYVLIRTAGKASVHGFDDLLTALVGSPGWESGTSQLVDHRKLIVTPLTAEDMQEIQQIVEKHRQKLGDGRCAFVVKDLLGFGLARMYELIGGGDIHFEVNVFYTMDEAVEWLTK
jgi:hypothetical protein